MARAHDPAPAVRRVVLVSCPHPDDRELFADREGEMHGLLDTAHCEVVATSVQFLRKPVGSSYIGSGKIEEVRQMAEANQADEVVFDVDLSPSQGRTLAKYIPQPIVDYTGLILHIFANNARTNQAQLSVELAQLKYHRSRLKRLWSHLDRIKGGTNMRGPGEKQLEVDKRLIDRRIRDLQDKLQTIRERKERTIKARGEIFKVALVGYTNAGKSSLMNALTDAGVVAENKLFATLDTRTSQLRLDASHDVVLSDTVGFIRRLPHTLVDSFHATLAEVREADLLLHVVDASQPAMEEHIAAVDEVLTTIGAHEVPTTMVFNKIDRTHSPTVLLAFKNRYKPSVAVSAHTGEGLEELKQSILASMKENLHYLQVRFPVSDGATAAFLRGRANVIAEHYTDEQTTMVIEADERLQGELDDNPDCELTEVVLDAEGQPQPKPERMHFSRPAKNPFSKRL
jgi:GTP-binding protein HflX